MTIKITVKNRDRISECAQDKYVLSYYKVKWTLHFYYLVTKVETKFLISSLGLNYYNTKYCLSTLFKKLTQYEKQIDETKNYTITKKKT